MIPREHIRLMHDYVHPVFWPVLWVYLVRLWATLFNAGLEGRDSVLYYVSPTGTITIAWKSDSPAERAAREPLGEGFERAPWLRLLPFEPAVADTALARAAHCTVTTPSRHRERTVGGPLARSGPDPPGRGPLHRTLLRR